MAGVEIVTTRRAPFPARKEGRVGHRSRLANGLVVIRGRLRMARTATSSARPAVVGEERSTMVQILDRAPGRLDLNGRRLIR
jgi:hypothetical protein